MENCEHCKGTGLGDDSGAGDYGACEECHGTGRAALEKDAARITDEQIDAVAERMASTLTRHSGLRAFARAILAAAEYRSMNPLFIDCSRSAHYSFGHCSFMRVMATGNAQQEKP